MSTSRIYWTAKAYAELAGLRVGSQLRYCGRELWHVRGFVDDRVVLRMWSRGRQYWEYQAREMWHTRPEYGWKLEKW